MLPHSHPKRSSAPHQSAPSEFSQLPPAQQLAILLSNDLLSASPPATSLGRFSISDSTFLITQPESGVKMGLPAKAGEPSTAQGRGAGSLHTESVLCSLQTCHSLPGAEQDRSSEKGGGTGSLSYYTAVAQFPYTEMKRLNSFCALHFLNSRNHIQTNFYEHIVLIEVEMRVPHPPFPNQEELLRDHS